MRIAVIGAGPAGLTSARQALEAGHDVEVFERHDDVGGIWNPASMGAYEGVRMQTSRSGFPFSDYAPERGGEFLTVAEMHSYLREYAARSGVAPVIRFGHEVTRVARHDEGWQVTAAHRGVAGTGRFDAVMVANGELWRPRVPAAAAAAPPGVRVMTAKDYRNPGALRGLRVLVAGGGVSGADIASELVGEAASVDWAVRRRQLFLPRDCGGLANDMLFSYIGRVALEEMPFGAYLEWLERLLPEYMSMYRATGLLPETGFHGAVHVNEKIIPHVFRGDVRARAAFDRFDASGAVQFADGGREQYDVVILCFGYEMPDYGFIEGFRRQELYEHFFWYRHPSLVVVNTPVDTDAFGTACPYFEAIAGWGLAVLSGRAELPGREEMAAWCERHLGALHDRRYYDCWLETVRIGLESGALPDPATRFADYWRLVSGLVVPANLRPGAQQDLPAPCDDLFDLTELRRRLLAWLPEPARDALLAGGQIDAADHAAAGQVTPALRIPPWLPYRQRLDDGQAPPLPGTQRVPAGAA
ncbi:dimethylaniline monooxygenase [Sphaerisporangium melleum]|uniref:Dimethylaniline monooxygenase n=1 Tax=Sphaerisporangium melleum TaxID=321316 RepID=A0A917RGU1_9ACTN|nr:NAD(P)-binding domain-containing protein [Sphaerisporangium melleum]GGL05974.1 dimethylaniline monooxygenase [Sphaerisporangium melleum]GII73130.1 dimethylaniline monooxygenase [Sphaerisporangium melleum]